MKILPSQRKCITDFKSNKLKFYSLELKRLYGRRVGQLARFLQENTASNCDNQL